MQPTTWPAPSAPADPAWLEALLAHTGDGCLLIDPAGVVLRANQALEQIFGVPCAALPGRPAAAALELLEQRAIVLDPLPDSAAPPPDAAVRYLRLVAPQPRLIRQLAQAVTTSDGSACGQLLIFRDMTPADELAELRAGMMDLMSHELRDPLTSIMQTLMMLRCGFAGEINDQQRQMLVELQAMADTVLRPFQRKAKSLVELLCREAGREHFKYAQTSLHTVVDLAIAQVSEAAHQGKITLMVALPTELPLVTLDQASIARVIYELLDNAIKFSPHAGSVSITAHVVENDPAARNIVVWVEDQGPGIPESFQHHLFGSLAQAVNRLPDLFKSHGLFLAHYLVAAHGGKIWVENGASGGSRFCFSLPLHARGADE